MTVKTSDAALANAAGQGINIALGNQRNFSWSSVAGAAVEAGVSDELQDPNSIDAGNLVNSTTGGNLAYSSAVGLISGATAQGAQVLLSGHGQIQFASIAANSFGNALGQSIVGQIESTPGETQQQTTQQNADQASAASTSGAQSAGSGASASVSPASGESLAGVFGTPVGPESGITTYAIGDPNAPVVPTLQVTTTTDFSGPGAVAVPGGTPTDSGSLYENGQLMEAGPGVTVRPTPNEATNNSENGVLSTIEEFFTDSNYSASGKAAFGIGGTVAAVLAPGDAENHASVGLTIGEGAYAGINASHELYSNGTLHGFVTPFEASLGAGFSVGVSGEFDAYGHFNASISVGLGFGEFVGIGPSVKGKDVDYGYLPKIVVDVPK